VIPYLPATSCLEFYPSRSVYLPCICGCFCLRLRLCFWLSANPDPRAPWLPMSLAGFFSVYSVVASPLTCSSQCLCVSVVDLAFAFRPSLIRVLGVIRGCLGSLPDSLPCATFIPWLLCLWLALLSASVSLWWILPSASASLRTPPCSRWPAQSSHDQSLQSRCAR